MNFKCGALKPKVDLRDYVIKAGVEELPETFTCANLPPVKNQHDVSSCVAHATSTILETLNTNETGEFIQLSTNFIYGMQGVAFGRLEGGMYLRDACKIVKDYGDPTKDTISGNIEQPKCTEELKEKLNDEVYKEARIFRVSSYAKCDSVNAIKHALVNYGPVLGSIRWYDEYKFKDKVIEFNKESNYGYHAIMICGWTKKGWLCQNSWGRRWNKDGYFIYPFTEEFRETWSFVDATNSDVVRPVNNRLFNYFYKFINYIINLFKGRV